MNKLIIITFSALGLLGCSTTPPPAPAMSKKDLAEWKHMKPSLKRLVALEGELKELIVALDTMGDQQYANQSNERLENDNVLVSTTEKVNFAEVNLEPKQEKLDAGSVSDERALNADNKISHSDTLLESKETSESLPPEPVSDPTIPSPIQHAKAQYGDFPGYAIQLASLKNIDAAKSVWGKLQKKHASVLERNSAIVEHALVNKAEFYRLKAIGFDSRKKAIEACSIIREQGSSCIVAAAEGEPLDQLIASI